MVSINLVRAGARCMLAASFVVVATLSAAAQGVTVSGRLYHSVSLKPIAGATVSSKARSSRPSRRRRLLLDPQRPRRRLTTCWWSRPGFVPARSELNVAQTPRCPSTCPSIPSCTTARSCPSARTRGTSSIRISRRRCSPAGSGEAVGGHHRRDAGDPAGRRRAFVRPGAVRR